MLLPLSAFAQESGETEPGEAEPKPPEQVGPDTSNLETPVFPDYDLGDAFRIRLQSRFLPATDFDDFDTDLHQPSLRLQATLPLSKRAVLQLSGRFAASFYDFDGTSDFLGGGTPMPYPFDDLFRSSLSLQGAFALNESGHLFVEGETWSLLANAFGRSRWESGSFSDGLTGGAAVALGYEIEKWIRIGLGVSVQSRFDRSGASIGPILDVRWKITDDLTLRNRGRGAQLEYDLLRGFEIFVAGFIESDRYRLGRRAGLPDDLSFRDEAVQVGAGFEWKLSSHLRLNAEAGAAVKRTLRVRSHELGTLWEEEGDPAAYLEFRLEVRP